MSVYTGTARRRWWLPRLVAVAAEAGDASTVAAPAATSTAAAPAATSRGSHHRRRAVPV